MPGKPLKVCTYPGCTELTTNRRCERHSQVHRKEVDSRRGTPDERGYGTRWRQLRLGALRRDFYLCRICGNKATDVDHIIPRARGGKDELSNLQSLCHPCHSRKTVMKDGGLGK